MAKAKPLQTKHWLALLVMLSVIVLVTHLAVISAAGGQFSTQKSIVNVAFSTRMIELPPPKLTVEPVVENVPDRVTRPPVKPKPTAFAAPKTVPALRPAPAETAPIATPTDVSAPVDASLTASKPVEFQPPPGAPNFATQTPATTTAPSDAAALPPAFATPTTGQYSYKVTFTKSGVSNQGKANLLWRQDGNNYTLNLLASYTLLFKTFNVFEFNSTGQLSAEGLEPLRFSDKRLTRSEVAAHFDRNLGKITFSANTPDAALQAGAQDRLSVIWQIAGMLAAEPARYLSGSAMTLQTVSATEAAPWLFIVNEQETLNLPTGPMQALRLKRNPRREFDQQVELWFAPALNYQPVRFRFTETNGDYVDLLWESTQPVPAQLF